MIQCSAMSRETLSRRLATVFGIKLSYSLTREDLERMAALTSGETASIMLKTADMIEKKLTESQILVLASEVAAAGMIRLLDPQNFTEEKKFLLSWVPLFFLVSNILRVAAWAPLNDLLRRETVALNAFLIQAQPQLVGDKQRAQLNAAMPQITALPSTVLTKP